MPQGYRRAKIILKSSKQQASPIWSIRGRHHELLAFVRHCCDRFRHKSSCFYKSYFFRKITDKLLAGISTVSCSIKPFASASFVTSSKSRTPHEGFRSFKDRSNILRFISTEYVLVSFISSPSLYASKSITPYLQIRLYAGSSDFIRTVEE